MKRTLLFSILISFSVFRISAQQTVGLMMQTEASAKGYVLFAPLYSKTTYLIDKCGKLVHSWKSKYKPGQSVYLLPDGNLLRAGNDSSTYFPGGGGIIEKLDWSSRVIWSYSISDSTQRQHHDIYPMPNGNILTIVWEKKSKEQLMKIGRDSSVAQKGLWSEKIVELKPVGTHSAVIVWEWHLWDHLIQDRDSLLDNYGSVINNPQLININFAAMAIEDWTHFNAVAYNKQTDQILISNRNFNEIFIIDHSTTSKQAASHQGGKRNKGGDLLYRWGNPASWDAGAPVDQQLFWQHSPHWIAPGLRDAGKIMIFNNGITNSNTGHSAIEVIDPPTDKNGNYISEPKQPYPPQLVSWHYNAPNPTRFFSRNVSNAQRLSNGNTLISSGANGKFFEIDAQKNIVWTYINPVGPTGPVSQGTVTMQNQVFRCLFYEPGYSGFKGHALIAGEPLELNAGAYSCIK